MRLSILSTEEGAKFRRALPSPSVKLVIAMSLASAKGSIQVGLDPKLSPLSSFSISDCQLLTSII